MKVYHVLFDGVEGILNGRDIVMISTLLYIRRLVYSPIWD